MVKLRQYEFEDAYGLAAWMNDPETTKYLGSGFSKSFSLDEAYERIALLKDGEFTGDTFAIADAETDEYLGECGLQMPDERAKKAEISIVLLPSARGKGCAEEALRLLIDYAFCQRGYERLWLKCASENTKALRLYSKLGFKTEGILRRDVYADGKIQDAVIMGLLKV